MFGLGFFEILVICVVALLAFGPDQLPQAARSAGRTLGQLRRTLDEMRRELSFNIFDDFVPPPEDRRLFSTLPRGLAKTGAEGAEAQAADSATLDAAVLPAEDEGGKQP